MEHQFFSKFRQLASSLDRDCNQLSNDLENSEASTDNDNRSCLLLREILANTKDLKTKTSKQFEQSRHNTQPLDEILHACKRVLNNTREQLESLEEHLEKYGYQRPNGVLSSFEDQQMVVSNDTEMNTDSSRTEPNKDDTFVVQSHPEPKPASHSDTDKISSDEQSVVDQSELGLQHLSVSKLAKENGIDPMGSPVRPVTFTRMLQAVPTKLNQAPAGESVHTPPHAPIPPITATPLMKERTTLHSSEEEMAFDDSMCPGSPVRPATTTPLMKSGRKLLTTENINSSSPYSPVLPCPPLLGTPGLKAFRGNSSTAPSPPGCSFGLGSCDAEDLPEPPDITSVQILKPEDYAVPACLPLKQEDEVASSPFVVAPVDCEEYNTLPEYIRGQFTLQFINHLTEKISKSLSSSRKGSDESPALKEEELREVLQLGPLTKAYMLVLASLNRIKLKGDLMIFVS